MSGKMPTFKRVRLPFRLTVEQYKLLEQAMRTRVTYTRIGGNMRNNAKHAVNMAWAKIGRQQGFEPGTQLPGDDPTDRWNFTAETLVKVEDSND